MAEIKYPIREALRKQGITQDELAVRFGKTRQTVSRYLSDYERTGTVGNEHAQQEFDRLMASELQRMKEQDADYRLKLIKARKEHLSSDERMLKDDLRRFILDLIDSHPDVTIYDFTGSPVTKETLDLDEIWVNEMDNPELMSVLTEQERKSWERINAAHSKNFREQHRNYRIEEACTMEKIWGCTESKGKPIIYDDEFECVLSEEEAEDGLYDFHCESFCMCSGTTARIYTDGIDTPFFEYDRELDVTAFIEVITDRGLRGIEAVKLEKAKRGYSRYVGQIDDLIPGYKYVYSLSITAGDYNKSNKKEYTLLEGYYSKETHPLK